jgi:hypothetical protein
MGATDNARTTRQNTVGIYGSSGSITNIPTVGGLKFTVPFRTPVVLRETGDIVGQPVAGEQQEGTWEFSVRRRDLSDTASLALFATLLWRGTYVRANWVPTNSPAITATDVDNNGRIPLFTIREDSEVCEGEDAERVELRKAYLNAAPTKEAMEDGSAEMIPFSGGFYEYYNSRE